MDDSRCMIRDVTIPEPIFRIEQMEIDGKVILAIHVVPGAHRPFGLHPRRPVVYVRRGLPRSTPERRFGHSVSSMQRDVH